ncbi:MAG TPA: iron-containing redox enzyme family protein [Rhizomicrobium sp.]
MTAPQVQTVMRGLIKAWTDFAADLDTVPLIDKLLRGKFRIEDYRLLLVNHRQQVIEGARWIARAASSVTSDYVEQRSVFLKHAVAEHRDYKMLESNYVASGGHLEEIVNAEKNIGTEALHAFMYQRASETNPFDLLGAMFIIEGLGQNKAGDWGRRIKEQLSLNDEQVSFLLYHGANDENHMQQFETVLSSGILDIPGTDKKIVKTARIVARLYRLQLEEMGNV